MRPQLCGFPLWAFPSCLTGARRHGEIRVLAAAVGAVVHQTHVQVGKDMEEEMEEEGEGKEISTRKGHIFLVILKVFFCL